MTRKQLEDEAVEGLLRCARSAPARKDEFRASCHYMVLEYHTETLRRIIGTTATEQGFKLLVLIQGGSEDRFINDWIAVSQLSHQNMSNAKTVVDALPYYKGLAAQHHGQYPQRRTAQVEAIFRVTEHLYTGSSVKIQNDSDGNRIAILTDEKLSSLIINHPSPEAVADLIITRNITDHDQIVSILGDMDSTAPAITEGIL